MTVEQLTEKLKEHNPKAKVVSITVNNINEWEYTSEPKLNTHKNKFGEQVFII